MEITNDRKEIINILEGLEVINGCEDYSHWRYKSWGIGKFHKWMEHKSHIYQESIDGSICIHPLLSNRLFSKFHAVAIQQGAAIGTIELDARYTDKMNYIVSLSNGLVTRYEVGAVWNIWELFGNEEKHITSDNLQEEKDAYELRSLKRLLAFIDRLEEEKNDR